MGHSIYNYALLLIVSGVLLGSGFVENKKTAKSVCKSI